MAKGKISLQDLDGNLLGMTIFFCQASLELIERKRNNISNDMLLTHGAASGWLAGWLVSKHWSTSESD
jgi:hypothetical protein